MSSTTVAEFASELKKTNETLLEQLKAAGVAKSTPTDTLTEADKQNLAFRTRIGQHAALQPEEQRREK